MVSGSTARVLRAPGRLVAAPTDLTVPYPYGGVEVGLTRAVVLQSFGTSFRVISEGLGEASDILEADHRWVFACFLRGWDKDAVQQFFVDNYEEGAKSGHAVLKVPGLARTGSTALGRALTLLYVPDNTLDNPAVLILRGVPDWSEGAELAFQRQEELGIPLSVECFRTGDAGRILEVGLLADLTI